MGSEATEPPPSQVGPFRQIRFHTDITSRLKNIKADALSHLYNSGEVPVLSTPIILPSRVVTPVFWDVDVDIRQDLVREPAPATCLPERTYIPRGIRDWLCTWEHTAVITGHPGITHTIQSLWKVLMAHVGAGCHSLWQLLFRMCLIQIPLECSSRESPPRASASLVSSVY
jgi:hypothetical protein